jgi:hypothetical protein
MGVGVSAGIIFIAQPHPHPMAKRSRIDDADFTTSDEIEMFSD